MPNVCKWIKEPFPGLSHFFGAALSIIAMVVLLEASGGHPRRIVAFSIYGACMILYLASGFAHSVYCSPQAGKWFDRFDYMAIYLLIAGTYTPVCLIAIPGAWGWSILSAEWLMAGLGIGLVLSGRGMSNLVRAVLYVTMGWLAVIAAVPVLSHLSTPAVLWMVGGGVVYSVGAAIFVFNRPNLWPGRFCAHDLWHCMVLTGSGCHFVLMLCIIS